MEDTRLVETINTIDNIVSLKQSAIHGYWNSVFPLSVRSPSTDVVLNTVISKFLIFSILVLSLLRLDSKSKWQYIKSFITYTGIKLFDKIFTKINKITGGSSQHRVFFKLKN